MKRSASVFVFLLASLATPAFAQQGAGGLNDQEQRGRQVMSQACGLCHLPLGIDAKTLGPTLSKATAGGNDAAVRQYILEGTRRMPAFKYYLSTADVDALIAYLKTVPPPAPAPAARGAR